MDQKLSNPKQRDIKGLPRQLGHEREPLYGLDRQHVSAEGRSIQSVLST